jgi:hypothetical protein
MKKINYVALKRAFGNRVFCVHDVFALVYPNRNLGTNAIRLLMVSRSLKNLAKDNQITQTFPNEYKLKTI